MYIAMYVGTPLAPQLLTCCREAAAAGNAKSVPQNAKKTDAYPERTRMPEI
jgi:hypothetical protein